MTRRFWFGIFFICFFVSCDPVTRDAHRIIDQARRLLNNDPDSVLVLIDSVMRMEANLSEQERMEMALLQGSALYAGSECPGEEHNISSMVIPLPELDRAADFFAKKKEYGKAAIAALYDGYSDLETNDKDGAMQAFKQAEQFGHEAGDSLTVARSQYQMGKMLFKDYMEKEAVVLFKSADSNFGTYMGERALSKNLEAISHIMLKQFDTADLCLRQSLEYAEQGHSEYARRKALNNYSILYSLQGEYEKALDCLRQLGNTTEMQEPELLMLHLNLGKIFCEMNEIDSAAYHYQQMELLLPNTDIKEETKVSGYGALSRFAEMQGDPALALKYRKEYEKLASELQIALERKNIYRIQRQYDYETLQNTMNRRIIRTHRIIIITVLLLLIACFVIGVFQHRQKKLLKAEEDMRCQIDAMKQDLDQSIKTAVLDEEMAARIRMILIANRIIKHVNDPKNEWKPLVDSVMGGKANMFDAARSTIETIYPNLQEEIKRKYPELSETETRVCLLSFYNLSNAEMAELLQLRINTVNQNRSSLRKKMDLKPYNMKEQLHSVLSK